MQEILLSIGGILVVQVGLTVRKWISERKNKKSDSDIRQELLNLISDLKGETAIFKNQIKTFTEQINKLQTENLVLMKQYNIVVKQNKEMKKELNTVSDYVKRKTFESTKKDYAKDLIKAKNSSKKINLHLKSFLEKGSCELIKIFTRILKYGIRDVDIKKIESRFKDIEDNLRLNYSCDDMDVNKRRLENIIYTERGKFLTKLTKIKSNNMASSDIIEEDFDIACDVFIDNLIIEIKNL